MSLKIINELVKYFFHHQITLKMYHFQTKSYGAHKTSDIYLTSHNLLMDKFMEVAQGIYGTIDIKTIDINVTCVDDNSIIKHLDKFCNTLNALDGRIKEISLINLRDEMVAEAQQLKYLLTFK